MEKWQEQYAENTAEIQRLSNFYASSAQGFADWYSERREACERIRALRDENLKLLEEYLFPSLDELHSAGEETIRNLDAFSDALMDWKTNLDCGVYTAIHDALLSVFRVRKDRGNVIRELYKLGMGYYYLRRFLEGIEADDSSAFAFQNEMLFTEAGSYIRYYDEIDDEATRGFIIRALANTALCTDDVSRKVAASAKTLQITQDPHYREKAPGLPWDAFVRKTHQQMSANRSELSSGGLTSAELAVILDSCYEVFKPEEQNENPSIRWLWPYYEMEYNCGIVSLEPTMRRLESLIERTPKDRYDMSGLYGNVQLPIYYGRLLKDNPKQKEMPAKIRFLNGAYRKMLDTLLTCPAEYLDDYFFYTACAVITDYYEIPGVPTYREVTKALMKRFGGEDYIRMRRTGALTRCICGFILAHEGDFFDDIPFIAAAENPEAKRDLLLEFAEECGLYFDFGLIKMNIGRTMMTRNLFENEYRMYLLHTISGHDDLLARPSTRHFADVALGHHRWYDGTDGCPAQYIRTESPYRQMTDVAACAAVIIAEYDGDLGSVIDKMQKTAGRQFSPMVAAYLTDPALLAQAESVLSEDPAKYYEEVWSQINTALS